MFIRNLTILCISMVAQFSVADIDSGNFYLPMYIDLENRLIRIERVQNDPEMGLGNVFHKLSDNDKNSLREQIELERWTYLAQISHLALAGGNVERFYESMQLLLDKYPDLSEPFYAAKIAELFHIAIEADISINNDSFLKVFGVAIVGLDKSTLVFDEQKILFESSFYYATNNTAKLTRIAIQLNEDDGYEGRFTCGYTLLLLGKLTLSNEDLRRSVNCFDKIQDDLNPSQTSVSKLASGYRKELEKARLRLAFERASMHRADALRQWADYTNSTELKRQLINDAATSAALARSNIELIENPLMWGTAHKITSEVLDSLYAVESSFSSASRIAHIASRRDRAQELSILYR